MQRQIGRQSEIVSQPQKAVGTTGLAEQVKDIFYLCLSNWYWFVIALGITLGYAFYFLKKTVPVYERTTSILIKSEDKTSDNAALVDLGIVQINTNLSNELMTMKTGAVAEEIVRRLHLDVEYKKPGTFHDEVLYGMALPIETSFVGIEDNTTSSFNLDLDNGKVTLTDFVLNGSEVSGKWEVNVGDTVNTPAGKIAVIPTPSYNEKTDLNVQVVRSSINSATGNVQGRINPHLRDQNASIIDISYKDVSPVRAEDILNTLVSVYNENWVKERNQKTVNTNQFIKERLAYIEEELGEVEQSISDWKSRNLILDVGATGGIAQSRAIQAEDKSHEIENQIYMNKYIRGYLNDGQQSGQLLPANLGMTNTSIEGQIGEYNALLLKRNNHLANSSLQNPLVRDMDEQLAALKGSILLALDHELAILQSQQNDARMQYAQAIGRVASNPQQERQLLSVERQQKVKEELYLFLLQKREENELSQAFAAYNSQLIEPPHGSWAPVEPVAKTVYLLAVLLGLAVPGGIIALKEILNTSLRGKKDIENLTVPYIGEIPQSGKKRFKKKTGQIPTVLVEPKNRNIINESFRVLRTNLSFMLGPEKQHPVIMVTSLNPGSGKTFLSANLSAAFGLHDKKVLLIDLDMRKGSLSEYVSSPRKGVSNYLSGHIDDWHNVIQKLENIDVIPCGALPPNPTELLLNDRFKELIEAVKKEYDYIFIDCPPVEVVADASVINRISDLTIFIVRIGHLERSYLNDIEKWYQEGKYQNMALVLNGTESSSKYGYGRYGYGYGYGYGN